VWRFTAAASPDQFVTGRCLSLAAAAVTSTTATTSTIATSSSVTTKVRGPSDNDDPPWPRGDDGGDDAAGDGDDAVTVPPATDDDDGYTMSTDVIDPGFCDACGVRLVIAKLAIAPAPGIRRPPPARMPLVANTFNQPSSSPPHATGF
jgi:hypothetical protein